MQNLFLAAPLWVIFVIVTLLFLACVIGGFRVAHTTDRWSIHEAIPTSLLGLSALLISFTFSMSINRYDSRREMVVTEANAIGTAYLRSQTLPKEEAQASAHLFQRYLAEKVKFGALSYGESALAANLAETQRIQNELWKQAIRTVNASRNPIDAIYLDALNSMIDIHSERTEAILNAVPLAVFLVLAFTICVSLLSLSFLEGSKKRDSQLWLVLLSLVLAIVITLVVDLDRPRRGSITTSQAPIQKLAETLNSEIKR